MESHASDIERSQQPHKHCATEFVSAAAGAGRVKIYTQPVPLPISPQPRAASDHRQTFELRTTRRHTPELPLPRRMVWSSAERSIDECETHLLLLVVHFDDGLDVR
jgi:hypothetical protein